VKNRPKGLLALAALAAVLAGGAWAFPPGAAKTAPATPDCCCADPSCPPGCCPDCTTDCCLTAAKAPVACCDGGDCCPDGDCGLPTAQATPTPKGKARVCPPCPFCP
jgi:hypothetical protein